MLPRVLIILLCPLLSAGGAWIGHRYFGEAAEFMSPGSVALMVRYHADAQELARLSFAVATGLLALSVPASALLAGRFRNRGAYWEALVTAVVVGLITSIAALLFYRNEMRSLGLKMGEFLAFMRDSKREIAFNPLTRSLLFGAALALLAGLVRGLFSPLKGKK
jgi:hypothetical protein